MAFLQTEDLSGEMDAVIFPRVFEERRESCREGSCVLIKGRRSERDGKVSILADDIMLLSSLPKDVWVMIPEGKDLGDAKEDLNTLAEAAPGNDRLLLYVKATGGRMTHKKTVNAVSFAGKATSIFGEDCVKIVN